MLHQIQRGCGRYLTRELGLNRPASALQPGVSALILHNSMIQIRTRPQRPAKSGEGVVEGDRLEVAAAEDIEQLAETVGDGGQVGVANHDLLGLK